MKPNSNILVAMVLAVVNPISLAQEANAPTEPTDESPSVTLSSATQNAGSGYVQPEGEAYQGPSDPRWKWWKEMSKKDPSFEWKAPINFFGKAIDQDLRPIAGAKIRFQWTDLSARGVTEKTAETDANGAFSLSNERGKRLIIWVSKDGYNSDDGVGGKSFEYAAFFEPNFHRPDSRHPVVFKFVKKLPSEPLVVRHTAEHISYDSVATFDLTRGAFSPTPPNGPALKFILEREQADQGKPFTWSWKLQCLNGDLMETDGRFPQVAPESGYGGSWERSEDASAQPFVRSLKVSFYCRANTGHFSRIEIELSHSNARELGANVIVNYYLNPQAGSRNLEFDPSNKGNSAN